MGLAAVLKPAVEAAGIVLACLLNGAAMHCEGSAEELLTAHKTTCTYRLCMRLPRFASEATG